MWIRVDEYNNHYNHQHYPIIEEACFESFSLILYQPVPHKTITFFKEDFLIYTQFLMLLLVINYPDLFVVMQVPLLKIVVH